MFRAKHLLTGLALSVAASGNIAQAAQPKDACTYRDSAVSHLSSAYRERTVALGLASNGGVLEILTNEAGTIWSIILTTPDGVSCMVATGEHWEPVQPIKTRSRI